MRNHRLKASQETHHLEPGGCGVGCSAHPRDDDADALGHRRVVGRGTSLPGDVAGGEATVKACGVAVAMLQGHRWAPTPSKGSAVNVGTTAAVPAPDSQWLAAGNARRQQMLSRWGGGPVVVRGRESRSHGEGVQRDRSTCCLSGGRW